MKYSIDKQEAYTILAIQEDSLNSVLAPDLKSELVILRNEGVPNLILNLEHVKFVDSSGLSAILTANRLWDVKDSFILTGIEHSSVKKLIEISRLDGVLTILPTTSEAVDFVFMDQLEKELKGESNAGDEK